MTRGFFSTIAASDRADWNRTSNRRSSSAEHQAVGRALRHAHREHARQPAPDGEVLVRIDQRVDQLADPLFGDLPQREHGVVGDRIPGQQRDDVRHEARPAAHPPATAPPRRGRGCASAAPGCPECPDRAGRRGALWRRADRSGATWPVGASRCVAHQRPVRAVFASDRSTPPARLRRLVLERADVAAVQTAGGDDGARRADDGEPEDRRGLRGGQRAAPRGGRGRRRPRRPGGRTPRR